MNEQINTETNQDQPFSKGWSVEQQVTYLELLAASFKGSETQLAQLFSDKLVNWFKVHTVPALGADLMWWYQISLDTSHDNREAKDKLALELADREDQFDAMEARAEAAEAALEASRQEKQNLTDDLLMVETDAEQRVEECAAELLAARQTILELKAQLYDILTNGGVK